MSTLYHIVPEFTISLLSWYPAITSHWLDMTTMSCLLTWQNLDTVNTYCNYMFLVHFGGISVSLVLSLIFWFKYLLPIGKIQTMWIDKIRMIYCRSISDTICQFSILNSYNIELMAKNLNIQSASFQFWTATTLNNFSMHKYKTMLVQQLMTSYYTMLVMLKIQCTAEIAVYMYLTILSSYSRSSWLFNMWFFRRWQHQLPSLRLIENLLIKNPD